MEASELFAVVFVFGIFGGVVLVFLALQQRTRLLEMQHRERMAMIERGQIPLPASANRRGPVGTAVPGAASRSMSLGIVLVGLGLALATLISFAAGAPDTGVGLGGAVAVLGGAFIVKSLIVRPDVPPAAIDHLSDPPQP